MHRRARAVGLALTSATLLAGTVLTAAPASAASISLTAAYCAAQANGNVYTYTQAKGVKTCTITYPARLLNDAGDHPTTASAPYTVTPAPPDAAYQGDYSTATYWTSSKVLTQKGGQAIQTSIPNDIRGATVITAETCAGGYLDGTTFVPTENTYTVICADLGMYPDLVYVGP